SVIWMFSCTAFTVFVAALIMREHSSLGFRLLIHHTTVVFVACVLVFGGIWFVRNALSPLDQLRKRLAAVRDGSNRHVEGRYPTEVEPLVDDLNALLDDRERAIARAHATAGDLAHGLKTPLAVLAQEATIADAAGHHELASIIAQQVQRMQRQIDVHLAHTR